MLREKIVVGTGKKASISAKEAGASKSTVSRILNGKQNFYFKKYHELIRMGIDLPITKMPVNTLIEMGIRKIWPEISKFDLDDLRQECFLRIMGLNKIGNNPDAIVIYWSKKVAKSFLKQYIYRRNITSVLSNLS